MKRRSLLEGRRNLTMLAVVLLALLAGWVSKEGALPTTPVATAQAPPKPVAEPVNLGPVINTELRQS